VDKRSKPFDEDANSSRKDRESGEYLPVHMQILRGQLRFGKTSLVLLLDFSEDCRDIPAGNPLKTSCVSDCPNSIEKFV
jgi:hypothetical protein